ncbi:MAG: DUF2066 domain-containing protein [Alphaproteobacteria bacterium]|nr:DUF2066 domain-containing protein [Alphaproteobacteria bacterium]
MGKPIRFILSFILLCITFNQAIAGNEVFSVKNIDVDVTDISSAIAKEKAIASARDSAFKKLLSRLTLLTPEEQSKLNIIDSDINSIISDFYISNEKSSDVRYKGSFHFNFNPKKTSSFLNQRNIAFTSIKSSPVLVIPVWVKNIAGEDQTLLWEENNLWKQAWQKFYSDSFLVPHKLPIGDLTDLYQISKEEVMSGSIENIKNILSRYEVKDIVVTVAKIEDNNLRVYINRYGLNGISSNSSILVDGENKTYGEVLTEAIEKVNNELSLSWKEQTITKGDERNFIDAEINISSIEELNRIKDALKEITIINEFKENILRIDSAIIDIYYQGRFFDLKLALSQKGLIAEKTDVYSCKLFWEDKNE